MFLKQYYLSCLAHASYLIVDEKSGTAAVVDPQRDIDQYVADTEANGWTIRHVLLTHLHADFLAGHLELRQSTGATIHIGVHARTEFAVTPMLEDTPLTFGSTRLRFLETPGHTPESVCILVDDLDKDPDRPQAVLTGDTLFIGDVGRPDLMTAVGITAEELAGQLYDSLHGKLLTLPDETLVYPAHGAGSMCGKNLSSDTVSTLGAQRQTNYALQSMSRPEFVSMITAGQPAAPAYFAYDAMLNSKERPTLDESLSRSLNPLTLEEVLAAQRGGAVVVDTRDPVEFCRRHLAGSVSIGLIGKYATWAGSLLDRERPILILAEEGRQREAAVRLGRIGFDHVDGFLKDGPGALLGQEECTSTLERIDWAELERRQAEGRPHLLLDVRGPGEWESGRLVGSHNVPLDQLEQRLQDVPRDQDLVVYCAGGYRSTIACSLLKAQGYHRLTDLDGGFRAWQGPVETGKES
jgi:hydroxyacylglutathione hydrolase